MAYEQMVSRYHWLQLSNEQRNHLRLIFNIPKSGGVIMQDNKMMSDGSDENDLKAMNIETMQGFLRSKETSFEKLYNATIAAVDALIQDEKDTAIEQIKQTQSHKRMEDIELIVESTLETIASLPMDAQIRIKNVLVSIADTKPNVKKGSRTKESQEGSNERGAESSGSGS